MRVEFVARDCAIGKALKDHARRKLAKAAPFLAADARALVNLAIDRHAFLAEVVLQHRHGTLHAEAVGADLRAALSAACDSVAEQALRGRKKHQQNRRRAQRTGARAAERG